MQVRERSRFSAASARALLRLLPQDGALPPQDFHSGGTVCSPTRATVLTGRNRFRDCVDYVYGCSDMTECVPSFNFAPEKTFTVPMAVRAAIKGYKSWFGGKVHPPKAPPPA